MFSLQYAEILLLKKLQTQIDSEPDPVKARHIYKLAENIPATTYDYTMATQEVGAPVTDADSKEDTKKKPGLNNPEETSKFMEEVTKAVDHFTTTIHQYEPYSVQTACKDFINMYYKLLCNIEEYFKDASTKQVLELIDDTTCKMMRMQTERECEDQELCKALHISMDNIMQSHHVMNCLESLPGFIKFEGSVQFAICELFHHLQRAHNVSSKAAGHLTFIARTLQPTQFAFILKHSVCPPWCNSKSQQGCVTLANYVLPRVTSPVKSYLNRRLSIPSCHNHTILR